MKGLAIKIASGVLVVALVVVVALAISGVFGTNPTDNTVVANADTSINNTQVLNDVASNKVFYITTTKSITDLSSYVVVKDPNGKNVNLAIADAKDEHGNIGFIPSVGYWTPGLAYKIQLISSSVAFAEENLKGLTELIFVVDAEDSLDCEIKDNVVFLNADEFDVSVNSDNSWTLTIHNAAANTYNEKTVFVYQAELGQEGKKYANSDETFRSVAYKVDPNTTPRYDASSSTLIVTAVEAEATDVYDVLNVHQKNIGITEDTFLLDTEATLQSVYTSDWYLATVRYLYQEELGSKNFNVGDYGTFKLDYNFKKGENGNLASVTLDLTLEFKGFLKSAKNARVTIKLGNVLTLGAKLNFQADPKAFDLAIKANLDTNLTVDGGFEYNFNNKDDNNNTEANTALKNIVNNVANIVKDAIGTENKTEKSYIFATWVIPVGTTPIQIVESMGIEVKSDLKAQLSASATNTVECEFGVAYVDSDITPYFNIGDNFKFNGLSLTGTWENKVGLYNEIGITACGIVSVNLEVSFGLYLDLAGRLEMDGWTIMNGELNIVPAYYVELGLYTTMSVNGKIWKINIKKTTFLDKKWPLWDIGYKYVPMTEPENTEKVFVDETVYLATSYFYLTKFDTLSYDIQNMDELGSVHAINWDEFNYEYDHSILKMVDNKVMVTATAPAEFTTEIVVTSKVNKLVSKTIKVVKSPEMPTADIIEKDYVKDSGDDLYYGVHLNTSKFLGISIDNNRLVEGKEYTFDDSLLKIFANQANKLSYGAHEVLLESSKGYLRLKVNVTSDKNIVPADGFGTFTFDKAIPSAVVINMPLYGNTITNVNLDAKDWSYSKATETFRVNASALLDEEDLQVTVNYSNDESAVFHIVTVDNRSAVLKTTAYDYNLNSGSALPLDVELYNNEITSVHIGAKNVTAYLNGTSIDADAFEGVPQGSHNAKLTIGSQVHSFTINVGANNMLIVNSKNATFDKAQPKDVVFNADIPDGKTLKATINGTVCGSFKQSNSVLTISSDYFKNLDKGTYVFKVTGAENEVELKVEVVNSSAPAMKDSTVVAISKADVKEKLFKWNLQETSLEDVYVVGLEEGAYTLDNSGILVNIEALAYGVNEFTVYTAVNAFDFQINVTGSMKWTQKTYNFSLEDNNALNLYVDMAEKTFSEVKVLKNNSEVDMTNTQVRYNNGVITLSNDFAYALEKGAYNLVLVATDGSTVDGATLNVQGKLPTFSAVSLSNGTKEAPFVIYTKDQFLSIVSNINKLLEKYVSVNAFDGVYFELGADIDLDYESIDPIGTEKNHFKGVFNGNGYSISNVKINDVNNGYTGLFAYNDGTIQNVRLVNISVDIAKHGSIGIGLVAGYNTGTIKNVTVSGGVIKAVSKSWQDLMNAYFDIGGVVGYNEGTVARVDVEVEITAEVKGLKVVGITIGGRKSYINVGAVVGYFKAGKVERSTVTASIDAKSHNDSVTSNGWYGNTELSEDEIAQSMRRCNIYTK